MPFPKIYRKLFSQNGNGSILNKSLIPSDCTIDAATKATKDGKDNVIDSTYLPLSGGTVTGNITCNGTFKVGNFVIAGNTIYHHTDNGCVFRNNDTANHTVINGGTQYADGGSLYVYGKDATDAGMFKLFANNGTTSYNLQGKPDGTLTWGGKAIDYVVESGTYYFRLAGGMQVCWGNAKYSNASTNITFPKAFSATPGIVVDKGQSNNWNTTGFTLSTNANSYDSWIAIGKWK